MVRITCVTTSGTHEGIIEMGWVDESTGKTGTSTRQAMYDFLKTGGGKAFVRDSRGDTVFVYPRENAYGTQFVQTYADNTWKDNLLAQPSCA